MPRFRIFDMSEFDETRGYFAGPFMSDKGHPELQVEDTEASFMKLPEEDTSRPHYHEFLHELTLCLTGRLHLIIDGNEVELFPLQLLYVPPGVVLQNPRNDPGTTMVGLRWKIVKGDKYYI